MKLKICISVASFFVFICFSGKIYGDVIFSDNFPTTTLNISNWTSTISQPTIDSVGISEPSEPYSLRLNGNPDGGGSWHLLANFSYNSGSGHAVFDITDYIFSDTRIRFETDSQIEMYLYIDNVQIEHDRKSVYHQCDLNCDSIIDAADLKIFVEQFLD